MRKTDDAVAQHLAHSNPGPLPRGLDIVPMRVHMAKLEQWELDCLMVMDGLEVGPGGKSFDRTEFLRKIERQFQEDEACRAGDPPVDDPKASTSSV